MRRVSAISVLFAIAYLLIAPLAFAETESRLPACCRRNGVHHCIEANRSAAPGAVFQTIGDKCPLYPVTAAPPVSPSATLHANTSGRFAGLVSHPSIRFQTEARFRSSCIRSRLKRGPPSLLS
ncbi:MAG: hypothetical protein JO336_17255 [Acidobacteriia bacterium]|nr:hypothetical protein [Terriglobia bacterium]MBV8904376.1 hypothetical protein [Terriglobia bacterium]